jgi:hypothetical protein
MGPGTIELKLVKTSTGDVEHEEEPMKAYAKRRNTELLERQTSLSALCPLRRSIFT